MASLFGGIGVAPVLGLEKEAVEQADPFAATAGAEEQERGAAAEFRSAGPVVRKAVGQSGRDFSDEEEDEVGPLAPVLKAALERFKVELAEVRAGGRRCTETVERFAAVQQYGLREIRAELDRERTEEDRRVTGAKRGIGVPFRDGANHLQNGAAGEGELERLVDVRQDREHTPLGRAPLEFSANESRFAAGAADPDDGLEVFTGRVGEGLGGVDVGGFEVAGRVDQLGPPIVRHVGGNRRRIDSGLGRQHGDQPRFEGAVQLRVRGEKRPALEQFRVGAVFAADECQRGGAIVINEPFPILAAQGRRSGVGIEKD